MAFQQNAYPSYGQAAEPLAFFGGGAGASSSSSPYYAASRPSLEGSMGGGGFATGNMNTGNRLGVMTGEGRWWEAFGTGGFEGEPSLMEGGFAARLIHKARLLVRGSSRAELEINPTHILQKSMTVLNPLARVDKHIMDDADLAGPFVFCLAFAFFLLLVS